MESFSQKEFVFSTLHIGADHGGYQLKEALKLVLLEQGLHTVDHGAYQLDPVDDYPKFAFAVAEAVSQDPHACGVLLCRSGAGMVIAANKVVGVRACESLNLQAARHCREHNNANVLALSGDWLSKSQTKKILTMFLSTPFSNAVRHQRRIEQIGAYEK